MSDNKQPLQNDDVKKVAGGFWDGGEDGPKFVPYTDTHITVNCPKCKSHNIWYVPGLFGIEDLDQYWCKNCDYQFGYGDLPYHGASNDW